MNPLSVSEFRVTTESSLVSVTTVTSCLSMKSLTSSHLDLRPFTFIVASQMFCADSEESQLFVDIA